MQSMGIFVWAMKTLLLNNNHPRPLIIYDGVCNLCHGFIRFVLKHEKRPELGFVAWQQLEEPLKSEISKTAFHNSTVVLLENQKLFFLSTAALRVTSYLKFPYNLLQVFFIFPPFFRNAVYRFIAKNRYQWFGKKSECPVPPKEWLDRLK